ncbi:hypothetical protein LOTGIDRAFT_136878 [Lottia gigantea]|uniref:Cullin N-terminal domain-containing protein n=1 Tax=Lottia gigantea TaxID=225164 RepID=V4BC89_LOTGI|nr:hypothetical protein LOTGIDRAFT_136878 [Lottia gigantea]ESP03732.1 hypothetical protein LOTGIDRAFT_136878 [Lottia gigantea]
MMSLTVADYENHYWPKLQDAIDQLLTIKPGCYIPISYEQMYSCVYKCVCKQFSERLYKDLLRHMEQHVTHLTEELNNSVNKREFVERFAFTMNQYLQALAGIVPIFNYMNRFYVENKLKTDLNEELRKIFRIQVVDNQISHILNLVDETSSQPFVISPPVMARLIQNLYSLNPEYVNLKPNLFSRYIPNVLPSTSANELERYQVEVKDMQKDIYGTPGFERY